MGLIDDTHAAPAEFGKDLVMADRLAYHDGVILPVCGYLVITSLPTSNPVQGYGNSID